jgi:hypothetical protein
MDENFQFRPRQKMILDDAGDIANRCWLLIPEHFPDVFLHEHIVMLSAPENSFKTSEY